MKETLIIVIILFIVFSLTILIILYFGLYNKGIPIGRKCTSSGECQTGAFCNSSGTCSAGTGLTVNQTCFQDNQCQYGLACPNGTCQNVFFNLFITIPSFSNMYIKSGAYYLNIINGISQLTINPPIGKFSYSNSTHLLTLNNTKLITNNAGFLNFSSNNQSSIFYLNSITNGATFYIADQFGNIAVQGLQNGILMVYFNNVSTYPNAIVNILTEEVNFYLSSE